MPHRVPARGRWIVPLAAALAAPVPALAVPLAFTGTYTQLTTESAPQFAPRIDGDLVVFSQFDASGTGFDVNYIDLAAPSVNVSITGAGSQRIHDVDGTRIAYTDESVAPTAIVVHDVSSGTDTSLADALSQSFPGISGDRVAFERSVSGTSRIAVADLAAGTSTNITPGTASETGPAMDGDVVAFTRHTGGATEIIAYDLGTDTEHDLGDGTNPNVDGGRVAFQATSGGGDLDVHVFDLATLTDMPIVLSGDQSLARLSGDFLTFTDDSGPDDVVVLYHLPTGASIRLGFAGATDFLSDVSGNRVVFTSNVAGNQDVWLFEFALVEVPGPETVWLVLPGLVVVVGAVRRRSASSS